MTADHDGGGKDGDNAYCHFQNPPFQLALLFVLLEFDGKAENPAKFRVFQVFHSTPLVLTFKFLVVRASAVAASP
jgi:hypothetical protein